VLLFQLQFGGERLATDKPPQKPQRQALRQHQQRAQTTQLRALPAAPPLRMPPKTPASQTATAAAHASDTFANTNCVAQAAKPAHSGWSRKNVI
jgi:hypothetical protein